VVTKDLAGLSKKDIPTVEMFDNFTSASFSMSFDDSSLGGSPYEHCHMECGSTGMMNPPPAAPAPADIPAPKAPGM